LGVTHCSASGRQGSVWDEEGSLDCAEGAALVEFALRVEQVLMSHPATPTLATATVRLCKRVKGNFMSGVSLFKLG
jgi:hypothetical protein